ncbi:hypothetical protein [Ferrovum sp.]|uniref:hypothetical protein n=1 Tax=Ferrovum sp. TaxID=2609467 RepID=UPI00261C16C8|nr:hypothetical protein [Ferrovum sp.]
MKKNAVTLCIALGSVSASAGTFTGGATFPEQIVQEVTAVQQYTQLAMQLQQQLQMVAMQAQNLRTLPQGLWQQALPNINSLINLVGNAQGLNYATQNTAAGVQQQYGDPTQALSDYQGSLQKWTADTNSSINGMASQSPIIINDMQSVDAAKSAIESAAQTPEGQLQAVQLATQMSGLMVTQLRDLQATIMTGNSMLSQAVGNQQNAQDAQTNGLLQMLKTPTTPLY